jgi:hypothetical protein
MQEGHFTDSLNRKDGCGYQRSKFEACGKALREHVECLTSTRDLVFQYSEIIRKLVVMTAFRAGGGDLRQAAPPAGEPGLGQRCRGSGARRRQRDYRLLQQARVARAFPAGVVCAQATVAAARRSSAGRPGPQVRRVFSPTVTPVAWKQVNDLMKERRFSSHVARCVVNR